jgi:hypothetical protein
MKTPILGNSYVARSVNAADNRLINMYPEAIQQSGKEAAWLSRAPGLRLLATIGSGPIRGLIEYGLFAYVVSGAELYKVDTSYTATLLGTLTTSIGPVSMADNGIQVMITTNPDGFIYNINTGVFAQISDVDWPGAVTCAYMDGYFLFNEPDSRRFWKTQLLDGTSVDPLDFASTEGSPNLLVTLFADHREVWLFSDDSTEVWYNDGGSGFPFSRIQGAYIEAGCAAAQSVAKLDNSIIWLGMDERGSGLVYRANGYTPMRISTHALEYAIQQYSVISDAVAYSYQQEGHLFYVLTFPTASTTWVYDVTTQGWHERASFVDGAFKRHQSSGHMNFAGLNTVGDYQNGNLYAFDTAVYADDIAPQKWLRSWRAIPTGQSNLKRTAQHSLQLDCESGVGLVTGQGNDPQVLLRWSDDGGHTWSNYHARSMGKIGEYGRRVIWRRLGMTMKLRDRVYEISGTDPVKVAIVGAELIASPTGS